MKSLFKKYASYYGKDFLCLLTMCHSIVQAFGDMPVDNVKDLKQLKLRENKRKLELDSFYRQTLTSSSTVV